MRRYVLIVLGILSVGVLSKIDLQACGDKLLAGGRGVRYQLLHSSVKGSILLYKNLNLPEGSRIRDPKLSSALKDVGHKLTVATNLDEFGADLKSGKYDLVIADASDIPAVREQVQSAPSKPLLISPVFAGLKFRETDYTAFVEKALKSRNK